MVLKIMLENKRTKNLNAHYISISEFLPSLVNSVLKLESLCDVIRNNRVEKFRKEVTSSYLVTI